MNKELEQLMQKEFNDTVGEILHFLDEDGVKSSIKRAVKASLYELFDKKLKPLLAGKGKEHGTDEQDEYRFNR